MIRRTHSLQLIDDEQYRRIFIAYSKRGWRTNEPLDDELGRIRPRVLKNAFQLLFKESIISKEQVLAELPYAPLDIETLCGLERGVLSNEELLETNLIQLPSRPVGANRAGPGDVVRFPRK